MAGDEILEILRQMDEVISQLNPEARSDDEGKQS